MRVYRERLGVPTSWWLASATCVLILGTTLWAGLSVTVAVLIYIGLGGLCAALLLGWGAATIEVTDSELRAGSRRMPLTHVGEVAVMDAAQTRALRGPRADPAAYLLIRPYLPESVYVELAGAPYWLIGTRRPTALAEAITRAGRRADAKAPWDDGGRDHAAPAEGPESPDVAHPGRESNAR